MPSPRRKSRSNFTAQYAASTRRTIGIGILAERAYEILSGMMRFLGITSFLGLKEIRPPLPPSPCSVVRCYSSSCGSGAVSFTLDNAFSN